MNDLNAVIFDMDGVLVDSEPFWRRAQISVFGEIGLDLTQDDTDRTMGVRIDEVVRFWYDRHPWTGTDLIDVSAAIVDEVIRLVHLEGERMEGVTDSLSLFNSLGFRIGLATSSSERLIDAVLSTLRLEDEFAVRCSATTEEFGKPHPGVFLTTASRLAVEPRCCLVIEDSVFGVQAGKTAGMKVIAVPAPDQFRLAGFDQADLKLVSLADLSQQTLETL